VIAALSVAKPQHSVFNIASGAQSRFKNLPTLFGGFVRRQISWSGQARPLSTSMPATVYEPEHGQQELGFSADPDRMMRLYRETMGRMGLAPTGT
jgi:hypothetical protein